MHEHDRTAAMGQDPVRSLPRKTGTGLADLPVVGGHVPVDVPITEFGQKRGGARVVTARAERTAEPRPRIDTDDLADHPLGRKYVRPKPIVGEERHARVVEGMVPYQVASFGDPARGFAVGLD